MQIGASVQGVEFDRYNVGESIDRCTLIYDGLMAVEFHFSAGKIWIWDYRSGTPTLIREL